jgi:hypothetical protein
MSIGFKQALWLTTKHNKPFEYEIYNAKDLKLDAKADVLVDVVFHGMKDQDTIKICASVFKDYKRPTLPDREIVTIQCRDGSKEIYSGILDIPLVGIVHDDILIYKNGIRMFENDIRMSCVVRLLPLLEKQKIIRDTYSFTIHNKRFVTIGGFLIPENILEVYKKTYTGLCKEFRPVASGQ